MATADTSTASRSSTTVASARFIRTYSAAVSLADEPATPRRPAAHPRDQIVEEVPREARLESPVRLGPLELVGVRMTPELVDRPLPLQVESFWRLAEPTSQDWRLDFQAHTESWSKIGDWGVPSDEDESDRVRPTSRWQPGKIYQELCSLAPPEPILRWQDTKLRLSIEIAAGESRVGRTALPIYANFALNPRAASSVLKAAVPTYRVFPPEQLAEPLPDTPDQVWTAEQLAQVTGGKWLVHPPDGWYVRSFAQRGSGIPPAEAPRPAVYAAADMRTFAQHELYSNLSGVRDWDTHDRVVKFQSVLAGAIVARPVEGLDPSFPLLQVEDPVHAILELGVAGRERLQGRVVAITGSAGKTSLSNMLAQGMAVDQRLKTTIANYNSRTGILFLLANTPADTDIVIMETAMDAINAPGFQNIKLVRPDIAVITNIAPAHLRGDTTLADIARRKANIFEGVVENGWAVIYKETEYFDYIRDRAREKNLNILTYGTGADADIRLESYDPEHRAVEACMPDGKRLEYQLQAGGAHMALNSLACLAVRHTLGLEMAPFLSGLRQFKPVAGRGEVLSDVEYRGKRLTIVDESFNANPLSMKVAIEGMRSGAGDGRNCLLILGDMLELGEEEIRYHQDIAGHIHTLRPDRVLLCGPLMQHLWKALHASPDFMPDGQWYENASSLAEDLDRWLVDGDHILLKGSNASGLGSVLNELTGKAGTKGDAKVKASQVFCDPGELLVDLATGERLSEGRASEPIPPQHLSHLLLLVLLAERLAGKSSALAEAVIIKNALQLKAGDGPSVGLRPGVKLTLRELVRAIVVCGARDAAIVLAEHLCSTTAAALREMQTLAGRIGLKNTTLRSVSGRTQASQRTTLDDLQCIVGYLYRRYPHRLQWFTDTDAVVGDRLFRGSGNLVASGRANFAFGSGGNPRWGFTISRIGGRDVLACAAGAHDAFNLDYRLDKLLVSVERQSGGAVVRGPLRGSEAEHPVKAKKGAPRINILGDTYFGEWYSNRRRQQGREDALTRHGYDHSFQELKPLLDEGDFNIVNFEAALSTGQGSEMKGRKPFVLVGDPDASVAALKRAGFHTAALANNHAVDAGVQGLEQTLTAFDSAGIDRFGAGLNAQEAEAPFVVSAGRRRFKFLSAYWYKPYMERDCAFYALPRRAGVACLSGGLLDHIRAEKRKDDPATVIVLAHWGEDYRWTDETQRLVAGQIMRAGADLIIGSGPHMLGEFVRQEGRWVVFSIGNGVFNSDGQYKKHKVPPFSFAAQLLLDPQSPQLRLYPIYTDNLDTFWQPRLVTADEFERVLAVLAERNTLVSRSRNNSVAFCERDSAGRSVIVLPLNRLGS